MKRLILICTTAALSAVALLAAQPTSAPTVAEGAALKSLDDYMAAFNARDADAWAATLNYPHVRIAGNEVKVWPTAAEYTADFDFARFAENAGWHHSAWDAKEILQSSADKVHVAVTFTRYKADGAKIESYDSLYIVTLKDGHWGTQARSSFAP